ncbi:hypothetical protein [Limnoglobus roseus]|uniref:Uncharacterized protein n=1 Tax=Limnoglobus roseus TaxID=2598579 RepID=A0A5C1ALF4_9BACT|nr:hypothetical protein [Limnoglobus roseus]QEL20061.1 hypothetical protein PX52LOC_07147 [Limnoglobus roseus]
MTNQAKANWHETLAQVEQSIGDCLAALERYETAFTKVLHDTQAEPIVLPPVPPPSPVWDEKLAAATKQADEVEQLLAEQEAVWGRWRSTFGNWQQMMHELPTALMAKPPFPGATTT